VTSLSSLSSFARASLALLLTFLLVVAGLTLSTTSSFADEEAATSTSSEETAAPEPAASEEPAPVVTEAPAAEEPVAEKPASEPAPEATSAPEKVVTSTKKLEVAAAIAAEAPLLTVSKTSELAVAGETITVTGTNIVTGFANTHGVGEAGVYAQVGWLDSAWKPSAGAASSTRSYAYSTWVKESAASSAYTAWTDNGNGTANFTWTIPITKAALDAKTREGATLNVFTVGAGGVVQAANELSVSIAFAPAIPAPSLSVSKTSGIAASGESITVTGTNIVTGFANTHGAGQAGVYAQVGWLDSAWKPSAGAASATRSYAYSTWVKESAVSSAYTAWTDNGNGTANFTWTIPITKAALDAKTREGATLNVFTVGAGGVVQAANELSVPIAFAPAIPAPALSVSKTSGIAASGESITVTGTNIVTGFANTHGVGEAGVYAQVGWLDSAWKPSAGAASSTRSYAYSTWVKESAASSAYTAWTDNGNGTANFTWTIPITKAALDAKTREGATLNVFTVGAGGVVQAANELSVPIAFAPAIPAPALSVSKTSGLNSAGDTITVTGTNIVTGFANTHGVGEAGVYAQVGWLDSAWKPSAGAASSTRSYAYSTWVKETAASSAYTAWTDNGNGTANFTWTIPITKAALDAKTREGATLNVFTVGAGGVVQAANELSVPIAFAPAIPAPALSVSKTSGLNASGDTITVTGTNIVTGFANTHGAGEAGVYAQVGWLDSAWKPSAGAASSTRSYAYSTWVKESAASSAYTAWTDNGNGTANFTWTIPITKAALDAKTREGATLNVFTVGAGGVVQAANELSVPIAFAAAVPAPALSVSKTSGIDADGETITVTGTNIVTGAVNLHGAGQAGVYAQVGWLDAAWKPSAGAASSTRSYAYSTWVKESAPSASYTEWTDNGNGTANFTWTVDITKAALDAKAREGATLNVFTVGAGGVVQPANELSVPIAFAAPDAVATQTTLTASKKTGLTAGDKVTLTAGVTPSSAPGTLAITLGNVTLASGSSADGKLVVRTSALPAGSHVARASFTPTNSAAYAASTSSSVTIVVEAEAPVSAGSLTWGVKQSLHTYVLGGDGGVSTSQGAGASGSVIRFPQAANDFNPSTLTGKSNYSGRVTFSYPGHGFAISLSNPKVSITSASAGTLYADVTYNGSTTTGVAFANLAVSPANVSTSGGATTFKNVGATLTAAGASSFAGFYEAGDALDSLSFVVGSKASGYTATSVAATDDDEWSAPATPPATEGIEISSTDITSGDEVTITASGFQPNEKGIRVVVYSTPVVLAEGVTANAAGKASWTGVLPSNLTGEHTLTFQGSVDRGVVLTIAEAVITTTATTCPVSDATLTWGFKESFRSYISGSIANGEWTVTDGATYEVPNFGWSAGTGSYDSSTSAGLIGFTGTIEFTGHDGALDTTVSNPQVRFVDENTAVVLLDIAGETQDGAAVDQTAIEFVELDLSAATVTNEDGIVSITDAPATLTAAGESAFGTYEAGEAFDGVSIEFSTPECAAPVATTDEPEAEVTPANDDSSFPWLWIILGLVLLAVIITVVVLVVRRRNTAAA